MSQRPVITGVGVVAPTGVGVDEYWPRTLAGRAALGPAPQFDVDPQARMNVGLITQFQPGDHLDGRSLKQTDRMTQLAQVAAREALRDSGLHVADLPDGADLDIGVVTSCTSGGGEFGQRELQKLWSEGWRSVSAFMAFAWFYAVNTGQIAIEHGLRGSSATIVSEGSGGIDALAHAAYLVSEEDQTVLVGAVDSGLSPIALTMQRAGGHLAGDHGDYRPFAADASGGVVGEGGAMVVLESAENARRRGARAYAALSGAAAAFDPEAGSASGLRRVLDLALEDAGIGVGDIGLVLADGAGTRAADDAERAVLVAAFGPHGVPVSVPKGGTGRLNAGSSALDVATAVLTLRDQVAPPSPGCTPDPDLDLVVERREVRVRHVLVLARGDGGYCSAAVVSAIAA